MKIKFANGVVKNCAAPTEQKLFRTAGGITSGAGWLLILRLTGNATSTELDEILTSENISKLEFTADEENGEEKTIFCIDGYNKITASTIRHAESATSAYTEIQMSKGA